MPMVPFKDWKAALITAMDVKTQKFLCCQTIRAMRRHPFKVGDRVYGYLRSRQRDMRALFDFPPLVVEVQQIFMDWKQGAIGVYIGDSNQPLGPNALLDFAIADGFKSVEAFEEFFFDAVKGGQRVEFQLIKWEHVTPWMGSNGSELDWWLSKYCAGCTKGLSGMGCKLVGDSQIGEQPIEWYRQKETDPDAKYEFKIVCSARRERRPYVSQTGLPGPNKQPPKPRVTVYEKRERQGQQRLDFGTYWELENHPTRPQLNLLPLCD